MKYEENSPCNDIVLPKNYSEKDLKKIETILIQESGHAQLLKQSVCVILLVMLIVQNLVIGSTTKASIIGIEKCGNNWWLIQGAFITTCVVATWLSVHLAKTETALKKKFGGAGIC